MGLPGSGKTYLTERLVPLLDAAWYNADKLREMANDWDFSNDGRRRQSLRMRSFADFEKSQGRYVVCDFVCPTKETRENFDADFVIWSDHPLSPTAICEQTWIDGIQYFSLEQNNRLQKRDRKFRKKLTEKILSVGNEQNKKEWKHHEEESIEYFHCQEDF